MSGFDNDTVYANNADFSKAGAGGGSPLNGLQLNGQLWIGNTLVNPGGTHVTVGFITSSGGSLTVSNNAGNINLEVTGGGTVTETLTGNSGGPVSPLLANINTVGSGSITIAGNPGTNTLTTQLTGLNAHSVLVGAGTATITNVGPSATAGQILQSAGGAADPVFSTATYPATTTINQILYSSSANVVGGITAGNNGVLISGTTGIPSWLSDGVTGQVLTATTNMPPTWVNPASSGTVTSVSVATANGFAGTVATATTTPAITISTTQTGLLTGNGTAIAGTTITQYNVLTAGPSNAPNSVAPAATLGVPLISQGSTAQPMFGTAVVAGGGTGDTSFTPYTPVVGGTTSTGPLQSVVSTGTAGQVLTSNGAAALPTFQNSTGGSGGWQLIQTQTPVAQFSVVFNTGLTTFTELMMVFNTLTFGGSELFQIEFSADNGVSSIFGNYWQGSQTSWAVTGLVNKFPVFITSVIAYTMIKYGCINLQNPNVTDYRLFNSFGFIPSNTQDRPAGGIIGLSAQVNWLRFTCTGGSTISGTFNLYGR
jgi:hypothetical protein